MEEFNHAIEFKMYSFEGELTTEAKDYGFVPRVINPKETP